MKEIRLPDKLRWNGKDIPVEGAIERVLKSEANSPQEPEQVKRGSAPNLNGYIFLEY